jgi:ABC-type arginine transport system permease subunit
MNFYVSHLVVAVVCLLLGFIFTFAAMRPWPQSFAECYVAQMRGQPEVASPFVISICQKRTGESIQQSVKQLFPAAASK